LCVLTGERPQTGLPNIRALRLVMTQTAHNADADRLRPAAA
jgi:hypothetical protein